jgi:hypothetical protein
MALDRLIREHDWLSTRWESPYLPKSRWEQLRVQMKSTRNSRDLPELSNTPLIAEWTDPLSSQDFGDILINSSSQGNDSDPYERVMGDLDMVVEELGAVVIEPTSLEAESDQEEVDSFIGDEEALGDHTEICTNRQHPTNDASFDRDALERDLGSMQIATAFQVRSPFCSV